MKIIRVKHFIKGYKAITLGPFIFVKEGSAFGTVDLNHERIHWQQEKEMLFIFFCLWYVIEFLVKLCKYRQWHIAYRSISFERESYTNQGNLSYLNDRKPFSWLKYLR